MKIIKDKITILYTLGGTEMPKNDFLKRMGQIYALSIQKGYTEDELMDYIEKTFGFLYKKEKENKIPLLRSKNFVDK